AIEASDSAKNKYGPTCAAELRYHIARITPVTPNVSPFSCGTIVFTYVLLKHYTNITRIFSRSENVSCTILLMCTICSCYCLSIYSYYFMYDSLILSQSSFTFSRIIHTISNNYFDNPAWKYLLSGQSKC